MAPQQQKIVCGENVAPFVETMELLPATRAMSERILSDIIKANLISGAPKIIKPSFQKKLGLIHLRA